MLGYELYTFNKKTGYEIIGVLPERRKNPMRITEDSIMNWGKSLLGGNVDSKSMFLKRIAIPGSEMTLNKSPEDIAESLGGFQKKSNGIDELTENTLQKLRANYVKCICCGGERSETEMQKVFYKQYRGICKMCFRSEVQE